MTISLEQLKIKVDSNYQDDIALSLTGIITGYVLYQVLLNPYSREYIPITNLGGIFYRSILIVCILSAVWIHRYGWRKAIVLVLVYYGFQEFVFTQIFFGAYGQTMFQYILYSFSWDIRIAWMLIALYVIYHYRMYHMNMRSVVTGMIFLNYFLLLLLVWPFPYFNGEGNIPLSPIPQLEEFMYNVLSPIWFYFLVRPKQ